MSVVATPKRSFGIVLAVMLACIGCGKQYFDYTPGFKPSQKMPLKAELILTGSPSQLPAVMKAREKGVDIIGQLEEGIRNDLDANLLTLVSGEEADVVARVNLRYIKGYPSFVYSYLFWSLSMAGAPLTFYSGFASIEMVLQDKMGNTVGTYEAKGYRIKPIGLYFYNWKAFPGKQKWPPKLALANAMDEIKEKASADMGNVLARLRGEMPYLASALSLDELGEELDEGDEAGSSLAEPAPDGDHGDESPEEPKGSEPVSASVPAAPPEAAAPLRVSSATSGSRQTAVVLDIKGSGVPDAVSAALTQALSDELYRTKRFILVNRGDLQKVMSEHSLAQSGATDQAGPSVEIGKLLAVEKMINGSVNKLGNTYRLSVAITDVQTAKVESNVSEQIRTRKAEDLFKLMHTAVSGLVPR